MKVAPVGTPGQPTNRVRMILPLSLLIASAYNIPVGSENHQIIGPAWLRQDIDQYEIQGKIDVAQFAAMQKMTPAQQHQQVALMEQSLLADRFKLSVHFETRELPVYLLVIAKGGPKLTPATEGEPSKLSTIATGQGSKMTAVSLPLSQLALSPLLTGPAGRMVVDDTGLKGLYNFTLQWETDGLAGGPTFFTALQEQLGLRMVPSKAPVEVVVIDHIEPPSAN